MKKQDVCVYIENEAQLKEARELLEKYGEEIYYTLFKFHNGNQFMKLWDYWYIGSLLDCETQITLSELEEILKAENL